MLIMGNYVTGCGQAHLYGDQHVSAFGCPMVGTFNVRTDRSIFDFAPAKEGVRDGRWHRYWLVKVGPSHYAWAYRWQGSGMPETTWELLSKRPLPDSLKRDGIGLEVMERWPNAAIGAWAKDRYQFQGFDWVPQKRVDSALVWATIQSHTAWPCAEVLDIGSHYGYHSFQASALGAHVLAVEPDDESRLTGIEINDHIEMQDVAFVNADPGAEADVILYLSVHHQHDPDYRLLAEKVGELAKRARQCLFVEVILPPLFGREFADFQVDRLVGGRILVTYHHKVRGIRRIYRVPGQAPKAVNDA